MSTADMARMLGVCAQTLLRLSRRPRCPALRLGRSLRWPVAETVSWLRSRARASAPELLTETTAKNP